jgi:DMSO/TMAO reductase YedYZ molybdopterin-dependent catalytic subunit
VSSKRHTKQSTDRRWLEPAGALAALMMAAFSFLTRDWFAMPTLAELIANTVLRFIPIGLFSFMLGLLGGWAKPLLLGSVILGIVSSGALIARFDGMAFDRMELSRRLWRSFGLTVAVWAPLALFGLLASPLGVVYFATNRELLDLQLSLLSSVVVYAVVLYWLVPIALQSARSVRADVDRPAESLGRRRLLGQAAAGLAGLGSAVYLGDVVTGIRAGARGSNEGDISQVVTPVPEFYTVSKNFLDPSVDEDGWSLSVEGMVERPLSLSYEELLALPAVEQHATLTCISNRVGGDLIDNAIWTGVRLADVLEMTGVRGEPQRLAFFGHDGYSDSFEIEKAMEPTTIIAYLMNGEPLTDKHGFPARLIVPGKYGIKNGKWLRRLELVDDFEGFWQARGWTNEGTIKTMSAFERPTDRSVLDGGIQEIGGVAFAGTRGISKVEVSMDGGETWLDVDDLQAAGPLSWTIWRMTWEPPSSDAYRLVVRATDGEDTLQTEDEADPVPDGSSGYHRIVVGIA